MGKHIYKWQSKIFEFLSLTLAGFKRQGKEQDVIVTCCFYKSCVSPAGQYTEKGKVYKGKAISPSLRVKPWNKQFKFCRIREGDMNKNESPKNLIELH